MAIFDLIENEKGHKIRKGSFSDPNATIEHAVKRVREAKGKNPNIYRHTLTDEAGGKYIVDSKFPGKAKPDEVRTRKFMDRSATIKDAASRVDGKGVSKPEFNKRRDELNKAFGREMSEKHYSETSAEPTSNSTVKNSVWNKLKNSKASNWLKNSKVGSYFTDSPLTPQNVALTYKPLKGEMPIKGWRVGWRGIGPNPVAYQLMQGMGVGGGYMPLPGGPEENRNRLRTEFGQDELSDIDTVVKMNSQGTIYLDPKLGIQPTVVIEDHEGGRYYKNAQTGHFEPLDYNTNDTYISADQLARNNIAKAKVANFNKTADYLNDIILGVIKNIPQDISKLPLPPMSADEGEIPSGTVVVGPDTEVPAQPVQSVQSAQSVNKPNVASVVKPSRRAPKPKPYVEPAVINNTPTSNVPTSNVSAPVAAPTLSSVASQAVRHNGGFDNYRRESVLSALRAAGGISPAEAVQRGIIPWEALNYV